MITTAMFQTALMILATATWPFSYANAQCGSFGSERLADAYERVRSAVTTITVADDNGQPAHGSGFVWDYDGHIITNNHVVLQGRNITVVFASGERRPATLIQRSRIRDLAILQVGGALPPPCPTWRFQLVDSRRTCVCDWKSIRIGNVAQHGARDQL
ncbi:exported hypothetical protein [Azospirillaceae bacterium]